MANNKQATAFRSSTVLAMPPEETEILPDEQKEINDEQDREIATYASLNGHPGWELIKKNFNETVARYRSGQVLKAAIAQKMTNADLGELTRTCNMVADELEQIVLTVETSAIALEEKKTNGRRK